MCVVDVCGLCVAVCGRVWKLCDGCVWLCVAECGGCVRWLCVAVVRVCGGCVVAVCGCVWLCG